MGLFGGPNFEKLENNGDVEKLVDIHLNTGNDKHQAQSGEALLRFGEASIFPLLQAAYQTEDADTPQEERARALLVRMGSSAVSTLSEIARGKDDDARILAVEVLGDMNAREALPAVEWVLALVNGRHGQRPDQLEAGDGVRVIVYVFTLVAKIAHQLGTKHAVSTLMKAMAVHREYWEFCDFMVPALMELTGQDIGGKGDPNDWIQWWEGEGHDLNEGGIAESLADWEQLQLLGAIVRLFPVEKNDVDNLKYHLKFNDGRSQDVWAYRCNEIDGRKLINVFSTIVEFEGWLEEDLALELLTLNGKQLNGTIQISARGKKRILEVADLFYLDGMTPEYYQTILLKVAGLADDLEKDLTGEDRQ